MSNQTSLKKQLVDQGAHFVAAFAIVAIAFAAPNAATGFIVGASLGTIREITEEGGPITKAKIKNALSGWSLLDVAFWGLGGLVAGLVLA